MVFSRLLPPVSLGVFLALLLAAGSAAAQSGSSSSRHSNPVTRVKPAPDLGVLADNLYRNRFFGFSFKVPFGWVERTNQMRQDTPQSANSFLLLSVFERPPEAASDVVNSAVVIAAETVSTYPGLKDASQYFGPLTEVTTSKGFRVVNQAYDFTVGSKRLVRADFSKELGKLTMYQSTLVVIEKAYVASFTFIAGSEDELEDLVGALQFRGSTTRNQSSSH
jgi:hypothetical protein